MKHNTQTPPTPTLNLCIEAPIEYRSIMVAVGTIIEDYSGTYQCVPLDKPGRSAHADQYDLPPCAGCDVPWLLCRIMCCTSADRRDNTDIHFIKLRDHE